MRGIPVSAWCTLHPNIVRVISPGHRNTHVRRQTARTSRAMTGLEPFCRLPVLFERLDRYRFIASFQVPCPLSTSLPLPPGPQAPAYRPVSVLADPYSEDRFFAGRGTSDALPGLA